MKNKNKLLPCPFCGGEAIIEYSDTTGQTYITCGNCTIELPNCYETDKEAIKVWNDQICAKSIAEKDEEISRLKEENKRTGTILEKLDEEIKNYRND